MKKSNLSALTEEAEEQDLLSGSEGSNADEEAAVPSWFVRTYHKEDAGELAARYKSADVQPEDLADEDLDAAYAHYRKRLEDRFRMAQNMVDHQASASAEARHHSPSQRRRVHLAAPAPQFLEPPAARSPKAVDRGIFGVSMPVAVALTALACGAGSAGGYFMANPAALNSLATASTGMIGSYVGHRDQAVAANDTANVSPKVVKIATVDVSDVSGPVNAPIPLEISALPPDTKTPINLKISGLPPNSYLTTGTEVKQGEWVLRPEDIAAAQLIVQRSDTSELGLLVTALDAHTGAEAAPTKTMKVALDLKAVPTPGLQPPPVVQTNLKQQVTITPVSAAPDQNVTKAPELPQAVPPPNEVLKGESASFLEKGDMLLKSGDIIAARQFYLRAFELNDANGAYGVARTYDPKVYADLKVRGLSPDPDKAKEWYGKAAAGGIAAASQELVAPPH